MLPRLNIKDGLFGDADAPARKNNWLLRSTGWIMFALVAVFASWFFSYTDSTSQADQNLTLQVLRDASPVSDSDRMREKLSGLPVQDVHRTGLSAPVFWARILVPTEDQLRERVVHVLEKNIGRAEFSAYAENGSLLFSGSAGAMEDPDSAHRAFPGFSITLPEYLAWIRTETGRETAD